MPSCFIDHPTHVSREEYMQAIDKMTTRLRNLPGIISVYQIGSVSNPGISDIDMLVVVEDGIRCKNNPRDGLTTDYLYLFTHGLFGVSKSHFIESQKFTFFHNYKHLWGDKLPLHSPPPAKATTQAIKIQTALEYLLKMFISMTIEKTLRINKVRALLLQAKALIYDFELLGVSEHRIVELVTQIIEWRSSWFNKKIKNRQLQQWIDELYKELYAFLEQILNHEKFYITGHGNHFPIGNNIFLKKDNSFVFSHHGMVLPSCFGIIGKKYFNIQLRFNKFVFRLPFENENVPRELEGYFSYLAAMKKYNRKYLPHFQPLSSSLNI